MEMNSMRPGMVRDVNHSTRLPVNAKEPVEETAVTLDTWSGYPASAIGGGRVQEGLARVPLSMSK